MTSETASTSIFLKVALRRTPFFSSITTVVMSQS